MKKKWMYYTLAVYLLYAISIGVYFLNFADFSIPRELMGTSVDPSTFMTSEQIKSSAFFSKIQWFLYFVVPPLEWVFYLLVIAFGTSKIIAQKSSKRLYGFRVATYVFELSLLSLIVFMPIKFLIYRLSVFFGVSNQPILSWAKDKLVDFGVGTVFAIATSLVVVMLFKKYGSKWWFYGWMISVPITVVVMFLQPIIIDPLYNHFYTLEDKVLEEKILALARIADIPASHVYEVNMSEKTNAMNAYVTGIGKTSRIVLWDTTLKQLTDDEILFVMAHEMGHFVHKDVAKGTALYLVLSFVGLAAVGTASSSFYYRYIKNSGSGYFKELQILPVVFLFSSMLSFFSSPAENAFSRMQERSADKYAVEMTSNPSAGISAFQKLSASGLSTVEQPKIIKIFRNSHPTMLERIQYLEGENE